MDLGLAGKLCLISGGTRGIGRGIAMALAREGAKLCVVARGAEGLAELAALGHATVQADVSTADGATAAIGGCVTQLGGIDVVIANAGKSFARDAHAMDDDDLAKSLDANLWSAARIAQRAAPHLIARGGGSITMISSLFGREAGGAPGYNVAKAAEIALAKALARDYAKDGIRVNTVAPGAIQFPGSGWDRRQQQDPTGIAEFVKREIPMGRFGTVEEVADVVTFVASPRAQWITGATIPVDGGQGRAF